MFETFWKEKYTLDWCCEFCHCAIIICPDCLNSSCNGSSCDKCHPDFNDFNQNHKISVIEYLTNEENTIYQKTLQIKRFILHTLEKGQKEIDWQELHKTGQMSQNDEEVLFVKELNRT